MASHRVTGLPFVPLMFLAAKPLDSSSSSARSMSSRLRFRPNRSRISVKKVFRALDVCLDDTYGIFDDQLDAYGGGQVKNNVGLLHQTVQYAIFSDAAARELKLRVVDDTGQVFNRPRRQVVDRQHTMATG